MIPAMVPRKRQRPNPAEGSSTSLPTTAMSSDVATSQGTLASTPAASTTSGKPQLGPQHQAGIPIPPPPPIPTTVGHGAAHSDPDNQKQVRKAKSWYGQWPKTPNKASASTSVARENILGGTVRSTAAADLGRFDSKRPSDASSTRSASRASSVNKVSRGGMSKAGSTTSTDDKTNTQNQNNATESQPPTENFTQNNNSQVDQPLADPVTPQQQPPSAGWLGWLTKTPATETKTDTTVTDTAISSNSANGTRPVTPPKQVTPQDFIPRDAPPSAPPPATSWFAFWSAAGDAKMTDADVEKDAKGEPSGKPVEQEDVTMEDAPPPPLPPPPSQPAPKAGSTWVFWSTTTPTKEGSKSSEPESGEIAVMGEGSESHPKPIIEGDVSGAAAKDGKKDAKSKDEQAQAGKSTWRRKKRVRPVSLEVTDSESATPTGALTPVTEPGQELPGTQKDSKAAPPPTKGESSSKTVTDTELAAPKEPANLLLPSFHSTYQMKENPSILQQITQLLLRTSQSPADHVFRLKETPKIRKAIAIGVHGLFPAMYLRPMIGQPTGTSLRFANLCADAIRRWTDSHGSSNCEIEKVALEGDGRIGDRVDNLWKLMLNWIDHIRKADLVIIACHSQGVPVSIMLLEKLIDLGIITNSKIGVCAMAGVALGPFPDYKSSILMGSAAELWDFCNPESANSQRFEAALKRVLDYGARVTFIGSIDDQLVPMESAVYSPASHPYIYRAVFIDGRIHAPDFIAHLVGFALKLRNLGVTDHGLIRELSVALAGSLYSGEGHSRLYYDSAVYDLAVSHALETTSTPSQVPCDVQPREGLASANPYVLPWIMRGMLEEDFVKTELSSETEELLRQFDDWKPTNKALKDVKYRLEAVRSKL